MSWSNVKNILKQAECNDTTLKEFQKAIAKISIQLWSDNISKPEVKRLLGFFDSSIANYVLFYDYLRDDFLRGKIHYGDKRYPDIFNLSFILLLRLMIHDIISMRNFVVQRFDAQFHSISRNFIEKCKIFCLCYYDEDFFEHYTKYIDITDEDLYNKYTREGELNKRIHSLAKAHKKNAPVSFAITLDSKILKKRVEHLCNPFVHTNNYPQLFMYALEDKEKINLSVLHSGSGDDLYMYKYMCEAALLFFSDIFLLTYIDNQLLQDCLSQSLEIYGLYVKEFYPKIPP